MKHEIENEKLTKIQKLKSIRNVASEKYLTNLIVLQDLKIPNIFLIQNKGKGPPGRTRSPGLVDYLTRANQPAAFNEPPPELIEGNKTFNENEMSMICRNINRNDYSPIMRIPSGKKNKLKTDELLIHIKPNLYSQLNFTIMKKHLFILILAVFAIDVAWGQALLTPSTIVPKTAVCDPGTADDSPLNPKPGIPYDYGVTIGNTADLVGNPVSSYSWWATKNPLFVTTTATGTISPNWDDRLTTAAGGGLLSATSTYGQTGGTQTVSITWSSQILAGTTFSGTESTFVAVMANGACSNNIQVFEINPIPAFTVDITNIGSTSSTAEAYGATISSCVSQVVSAQYNTGTHVVDMDYGVNTIYFEVISANFVNTWTPTITVGGLATGETATVTIYDSWTDAQAGTGAVETLTYTTNNESHVGTTLLGSTVSNTTNGVSMWLAVTVDHNNYETLTTSSIQVTVGGMDSTGQYDLANNCDPVFNVDTDDFAIQDITPRPRIDDTTGDPATPVPQTFIPKNNP